MKRLWIAPVLCVAALAAACAPNEGAAPTAEVAAAPSALPPPAPSTMHAMAAVLAPGANIESSGKGTGAFMFDSDTKTLEYTITFDGLTGPAAAAHIHGPAEPGANAGVVVPFASAASPITGTTTLTAEQAAELLAGKYYVNVHTGANRGGEIRGQIVMGH